MRWKICCFSAEANSVNTVVNYFRYQQIRMLGIHAKKSCASSVMHAIVLKKALEVEQSEEIGRNYLRAEIGMRLERYMEELAA